jgi:carbonic anhydrase
LKFNKQIFAIIFLSVFVLLSVSASAYDNNTVAMPQTNTNIVYNIMKSPETPWNQNHVAPVIGSGTFVHPYASVIGAVTIGKNVMFSPFASVRGDEGIPIFIGDNSSVQDGVVVHGLETIDEAGNPKNLVEVNGTNYSVYVGENVSLAHQAQVHGPASVGNDTFIGMQAFVFKAKIGNNCVLEPKSAAIGASIPDGRYIPAGVVITNQTDADNLPAIYNGYAYQKTNEAVVYVNTKLVKGYNSALNNVSTTTDVSASDNVYTTANI